MLARSVIARRVLYIHVIYTRWKRYECRHDCIRDMKQSEGGSDTAGYACRSIDSFLMEVSFVFIESRSCFNAYKVNGLAGPLGSQARHRILGREKKYDLCVLIYFFSSFSFLSKRAKFPKR